MPDRPDFTKGFGIALQEIAVRDSAEWAARQAEFYIVHVESATPLAPGATYDSGWDTPPAGLILYTCDSWYNLEFRGKIIGEQDPGGNVFGLSLKAFKGFGTGWYLPQPIQAPSKSKIKIYNQDIVSGHFSYGIDGYFTSASPLPKVKSKEPEERYRKRDWNYCHKIVLPNDEVVMFFRKAKEKELNYLKFRKFGKPGEKKLESDILKGKKISNTVKKFKVL